MQSFLSGFSGSYSIAR